MASMKSTTPACGSYAIPLVSVDFLLHPVMLDNLP